MTLPTISPVVGGRKTKKKKETDDIDEYNELMKYDDEKSPRCKQKALEKFPDLKKFY